MKNARLLFAVILVGAAAACSTEGPTGSEPDAPRSSTFMGGGTGTPPDTTTKVVNPT